MENERFPLLTQAGEAMLKRLKEHPHAPLFNYEVGERLTAADLAAVRAFGESLPANRPTGTPWLPEFKDRCLKHVPFYRQRGMVETPVTRADILKAPEAFVPDDAGLDGVVVYATSGTVGTSLRIPSHPIVSNRYLPLIEWALARRGVTLSRGSGHVAIVYVCAQLRTVTLPSVISYLGGAGFAKVNLSPADWAAPGDAARFIDDLAPELYTGDPFSLARLAELPVRSRPKALLSTGAGLAPGLAGKLSERFDGAPVLDLYASNETGPIAVGDGAGERWELFPHHLHVEAIDGELVVTTDFNPWLPLLRYRTGDFGVVDGLCLKKLQGRPPVTFVTRRGAEILSLDVATLLRDVPLASFRLHQEASGALAFTAAGRERDLETAAKKLLDFFGPGQELRVERLTAPVLAGKPIQFSRAGDPCSE